MSSNAIARYDRALTSRNIKTVEGTIVKVNTDNTVDVEYYTEPLPESNPIKVIASHISVIHWYFMGFQLNMKPEKGSKCLVIFVQDCDQQGAVNSIRNSKCLPFTSDIAFHETPWIKASDIIISSTDTGNDYVALAQKCDDNFAMLLSAINQLAANMYPDPYILSPPIPNEPGLPSVAGTVIKTK